MKRALNHMVKVMAALAVMSALLGCAKENRENGSDTIAVVPTADACLPVAGNPWGSYQNYGFAGYSMYSGIYGGGSAYGNNGYNGYNGHPGYATGYGQPGSHCMAAQTQGFCGCPANSVPVWDQRMGMGCVPNSYLPGQNYSTWNWNGNGFNHAGYGNFGYNNGCYSNIGQTCRVGSYDCGRGYCQPMWNNGLGICVGR